MDFVAELECMKDTSNIIKLNDLIMLFKAIIILELPNTLAVIDQQLIQSQ